MNSKKKLIAFTLATVICTWAQGGDSKVSGTLFWGNGDSLDGQLQSVEGDTLVWASPLFADPLSLDLAVLSAVRVPELEAAEPVKAAAESFRITLTNNNVLNGEIGSFEDDSITFNSRRHGTLVVRKDQIRSLQRNQNQGLVFLGPRGLDGWTQQTQTDGASVQRWKEEDDGSLTTVQGGASISQKLKWPKQCEVEFVLTSSSIPDFAITFGDDGSAQPRLEMWHDSFVACSDDDFVELSLVPEDLRKLHFFANIDFEQDLMVVYSHTGRKLGEFQGKGWSTRGNKITIEAVDSDLALKHLRISEWDGTIPQPLIEGQNHVFMQDGRVHHGSLSEYLSDTNTIIIALAPIKVDTDRKADVKTADDKTADDKTADDKTDDDKTDDDKTDDDKADDDKADDDKADDDKADDDKADGDSGDVIDSDEFVEVKLADISRVVMSTIEQKGDERGKTNVAWRNGVFLSGTLNAMDAESITLTTDFCDAPIRSSLAGVRRIGLPNTDVAKEEPDRLFFDGGSLRGNLTVEDHEEPIRWTPVGGRNATTLVSGGNARFQRGAEPEQLAIDSNQFPDVIYLHDGDVFPCRMESCDDGHVRIVSPVTEIRQLDTNLVKAMEFGNSQRTRHQGFKKEDWANIARTVNYVDSAISINGMAAIGHPDVMIGDAMSFRIKWRANCYGNVTFSLFANDLKNPETATTVNLQLQPAQIIVSDQAPNQNHQGMFFGFNGVPQQDGAVKVKNREALVQMIARDGKVHVSVNGTEATAVDLNPDGAGSKGLVIRSSITNVTNRNAQSSDNGVRGNIEIDDFLVRNVVGTSVKQFIQEEARELTLTVPRFRRDDPPTHVLLAPNGDLLRGRLSAVTEMEIVFESRLETFRFPRERVAALIWLSPDKDAPPAPVRAATAVQARLDNGFMLTMTPDRMSGGQLIGKSDQLGACRIPAKAIRDLFLGSPESREETMSYVRWIRHDAPEPEWETAEDDTKSPATEMVGKVVEDFELPTLSGDTFRLSDHADKVVVLDFWATWCGPCVAALPEYVEATSKFEQSDAIFVAVNLEESPERIKEFLSRHDLSPTVALDRGSVIARRFQVSGIPHSVVLGPGGVIKHVTVGYKQGVGARTQDHIQTLLSGD